MNLSEPFIRRPVATVLLTCAIFLAGMLGFNLLPVAPLPQVDFPTISVQASLPGASPETMAATVATPLERTLGRIASVTELTSTSTLGTTKITLQFDLNRDINGAARDVQAAINAARSLLPSNLPSNPSYRKVNPAEAPIMILALTSDKLSQGALYDVASTLLAQRLAQVPGIGQVNVGGSSLPAIRVELRPDALNHYGIGLEEVRMALASANVKRPKGLIEQGEYAWQLQANDQMDKASAYRPLIIRYQNNAAIKLADVADVIDSVEDVRNAGSVNGEPSVLLILNREPGANIIETVERVRAFVPQLSALIPQTVRLTVAMDRTPTIRASLSEVERSLVIAMGLVILVVFVFLRDGRATLIPAITVPVSLMGTFSVMYLAGFSLNNLSLMALTIATGFVVDDAIVVLENSMRHLEEGLSPLHAALKGSREIGFTVLSMSLSLIAVFIPILLMGGILGRLFREFAITLSVAIVISMIISLTTTPMLCACWLKVKASPARLRESVWSGHGFAVLLTFYPRSLTWALAHGRILLGILGVTLVLTMGLYIFIPKGFFPQQDTGRLTGTLRADQRTSFQAMQHTLQRFIAVVKQDPAVETVVGFTGGGQLNVAKLFISLKPLAQRSVTADQVMGRLRKRLAHQAGAQLFLQSVQDIRIGGRSSNAQYQYTLQGDTLSELKTWEPVVRQAMARLPILTDVNSDQQDRGLQSTLVFDKEAMARLNIRQSQVDAVLNDAFGQRQISTVYEALNQYRVVMELAPAYQQSPAALHHIYVSTAAGLVVPLFEFTRYQSDTTPLTVNHQGQFAATTLSFNLAPRVSLSDATDEIHQAVTKLGLPTSIQGRFQGVAKTFQDSLNTQPWLILAALVAVYSVLGMLYENYIHPITILSTLPSAGLGALLALLVCRTEFSVIALIGILLLVGIVKKNAIMMIDFALQAQRQQKLAPRDAIYQACIQRFRPIMMTTMAALLGALPLALGTGDGAELRQPLGISIVGGLIVSQLLTLYTTPVIYLYLDKWCSRRHV